MLNQCSSSKTDCHLRKLTDGNDVWLLDRNVKNKDVLLEASRLIRSRFNIFEMTLQIEEFQAGMEYCTQCQDPAD